MQTEKPTVRRKNLIVGNAENKSPPARAGINGGNTMTAKFKLDKISDILNFSGKIQFSIQDINLESGTIEIFIPDKFDAIDMILSLQFGV